MKQSKKCTWKYDDSEGSWETTCGEAWCFLEESTPKENGMKFCPFCGKRIK